MPHMTFPRIAIIGAGPGGLTLARLLQMSGYAPAIFEREASPLERPQGGSLDLHPRSGLAAVQQAGLMSEFRAIARYQDQGHRILDRQGTVLFEEIDDQARPEVDRSALRAMLLDSLVPGSVQWGRALSSIQPAGGGAHTLVFEDGRTETFDLVVGADGAWSRVRPLLSAAAPLYAGVTFVELGIDDVDRRHPAIARLIGRGSMTAASGYQGLIAQRNAHGHIRVYAAMRAPLEQISALDIQPDQPERARARLLELFAGWSPDLLALIQVCNDNIALRALYMLPIGHRWDAHPGATLLGDAAHLMSPFAGQGVNLAMQDAAALATAITDHQPTLADAIRAYEQTMFDRATRAAERTMEGLDRVLGSDAPHSTVAYFRQFTLP